MTTSFLDATGSALRSALHGLASQASEQVGVQREPLHVWALAPCPQRRVALVSGGGSGHEPLHAGFVGFGGLDAACPGEVFTSPHSGQIYAASKHVARRGGVLHVVKNYTGDRLNFAIAAERLRAEGIPVAEVIVDDDLGSEGHPAGRRGTAATMIVEKVLGAAADTGIALDDLAALGTRIVANSRSIAVAHGAHTPPGATRAARELDPCTLEYGVGIHGEPAVETIDQPPLSVLADRMVSEIRSALPATTERVIVLVNGLGGIGELELLAALDAVLDSVHRKGLRAESALSGTYVSALDMPGFSVTLTTVDDDWLPYWYGPHATVFLPRPTALGKLVDIVPAQKPPTGREPSPWLRSVTGFIVSLTPWLNALDQRAGDGDIGTNLDRAMQSALLRSTGTQATLTDDLEAMASGFLDDVGGSSGPLFGLLFQQLAIAAASATPPDLATALAQGLRLGEDAITRAGQAQPGDRTLIDALHPAGRLPGGGDRSPLDAEAIDAALDGARRTAGMAGKRGRAGYLGERAVGTPDPGAVAVAAILVALLEAVSGTPQAAAREQVRELANR